MARSAILFLLALCVVVASIDARKKDKLLGGKKHHRKSLKAVSGRLPLPVDANALDKSARIGDFGKHKNKMLPSGGHGNWLKRKWRKGRHGAGKHHSKHHKKNKNKSKAFKIKKHMPWLNLLPDEDCKLKCQGGEVCIVGPMENKPICVHMKDLKKSVKLFRKYQKKEKKAWKKFQKKHYGHHIKKDEYGMGMEKGAMTLDGMWDKKKMAHKRKMWAHKNKLEGKIMPFIPMEPTEAGDPKGCTKHDFAEMKNRIMGWFHVLHDQKNGFAKAKKGSHKHSVKKQLEIYETGHCNCLQSAVWEFDQMDEDKDGFLNKTEVASLGENTSEPCMQPYIQSCDSNVDGRLSSDEWCCCFSNILTPCYRRMNDIKKSGEKAHFMPRCDKEGYYIPEQCEGEGDKTVCWCVDYNGNMYDGTKTDGRADCSKYETYMTQFAENLVKE